MRCRYHHRESLGVMDFVTTVLDSGILLDRDRLEFGYTVRMHTPALTAAVRWGF